jgi:hypothetical protein
VRPPVVRVTVPPQVLHEAEPGERGRSRCKHKHTHRWQQTKLTTPPLHRVRGRRAHGWASAHHRGREGMKNAMTWLTTKRSLQETMDSSFHCPDSHTYEATSEKPSSVKPLASYTRSPSQLHAIPPNPNPSPTPSQPIPPQPTHSPTHSPTHTGHHTPPIPRPHLR